MIRGRTTTYGLAKESNCRGLEEQRHRGMRKLYGNGNSDDDVGDEIVLSIENTFDGDSPDTGPKKKKSLRNNTAATNTTTITTTTDAHQIINHSTKCAKMTEEHGMIRNGNLNGVGIANILANFNYAATTAATVTSTASTVIASGTAGSGGHQASPARGGTNNSNSNSNNSSSGNGTRATLVNGNNGDECATVAPAATNITASNNKLPISISNGQGGTLGGRLQFFKGEFFKIFTTNLTNLFDLKKRMTDFG